MIRHCRCYVSPRCGPCLGLQIVEQYMKLMGEKMDEEIGETLEELDGRFQTVRNRESNLGNFVADVWRRAAGAEIAILNSGSLRWVLPCCTSAAMQSDPRVS